MQVVCVDKLDESKIAALERCEIPIYEPGLERPLVRKNIEPAGLSFTTELGAGDRGGGRRSSSPSARRRSRTARPI